MSIQKSNTRASQVIASCLVAVTIVTFSLLALAVPGILLAEQSKGTGDMQVTESKTDLQNQVETGRNLIESILESSLTGSDSVLDNATPLIDADQIGAIDSFAFEQSDPHVSLSVYQFASSSEKKAGLRQIIELSDQSGGLGQGIATGTVGRGLVFILGHYYEDGSRGDAEDAKQVMYDYLKDLGGVE